MAEVKQPLKIGIEYNVPRIYEVGPTPCGFEYIQRANLPKAKAKPQRIFAVMFSSKSGSLQVFQSTWMYFGIRFILNQ